MRDGDDGHALLLHPLELGEDRLARVGVEVPRGLVREQHRRLVDQRSGDGDALFLSAGELGRVVLEPVAEPEPIEQVGGTVAVVSGVERGRQRHVLDGGQRRQQVEVLEDEPDGLLACRRALGDRQARHVRPVEQPVAVRRIVEQPEDVEQGRLPRPAGPHDGDELAGLDREIDVVERDHRIGTPAGVPLRHAAELDAIHRGDEPPRRSRARPPRRKRWSRGRRACCRSRRRVRRPEARPSRSRCT